METTENDRKQDDGLLEGDDSGAESEAAGEGATGPGPGETPETLVPPERKGVPASSWVAESLSIAGIGFSAAGLLGTRLGQNLAIATGSEGGQLAVYRHMVLIDGCTILLGVLLGIGGLVAAGPTARPWARPLATAALILGGAALIVSGVAVGLFPEPQPQPQPPGLG